MNKAELQQIVRGAMSQAHGDDLERANYAFRGLTAEQLKLPHGQSGKSREEIWNGYKEHRAKHEEAARYIERLMSAPESPTAQDQP